MNWVQQSTITYLVNISFLSAVVYCLIAWIFGKKNKKVEKIARYIFILIGFIASALMMYITWNLS